MGAEGVKTVVGGCMGVPCCTTTSTGKCEGLDGGRSGWVGPQYLVALYELDQGKGRLGQLFLLVHA